MPERPGSRTRNVRVAVPLRGSSGMRVASRQAVSPAGVAGSAIFQELISGDTVYVRYVLRKPCKPPPSHG